MTTFDQKYAQNLRNICLMRNQIHLHAMELRPAYYHFPGRISPWILQVANIKRIFLKAKVETKLPSPRCQKYNKITQMTTAYGRLTAWCRCDADEWLGSPNTHVTVLLQKTWLCHNGSFYERKGFTCPYVGCE